ncbi:MAG: hypothetical protein OXP66_12875 [Candidatus Tectomicrobia bacterium]|nr:hypothetical protein [Candidatus Tectomicrobia bacterium]
MRNPRAGRGGSTVEGPAGRVQARPASQGSGTGARKGKGETDGERPRRQREAGLGPEADPDEG